MSHQNINEIKLALEYARKRKTNRLNQNKIYRRKVRAKFFSNLSTSDSFDVEQSLTNNTLSINLTLSSEGSNEADIPSAPPANNNTEEKLSENVDSLCSTYEYLDFDDICGHLEIPDISLHPYTTLGCFSFAKDLIGFIRKTNISKNHANQLVDLIRSALPQPNTLPITYSKILNLLSVENLFVKRTVCISCKRDLLQLSKICSQCPNDNPKRLAVVFDAIQEKLFTQVYDNLYLIIKSYRERFTKQEIDNETNDIVYNQNYKTFRDSIHYPFISILMHLDGINLDKSKKHHLWILSCSIVEIPPAVRSRRENNITLSLWVAKEQPDINIWLSRCFSQLRDLKINGFPSRSDGRIMVKVYGVIGDTPALNLILNHNSHVGYSCCWYCQLTGIHINGKRQYYYDENVALRNERDFATDSRNAQYSKKTINGRHGISILENIVDIALPKSIITDYLHVTLLGHAKAIGIYLYKKYMKPKIRDRFDKKISVQKFPHFFNRKIRSLNESYLKATEIRNMLLYCILPMIRNIVDCDVVAHLGLFVIGIRLLHGRPAFNHQTADMAHKLLIVFYRDHERFYKGLQNFVLHIHSHFADLYRNHGSLCNINTFWQEDFMGFVSKCKNGTNNWADQLVFYLNIDFALKNGNENEEKASSTSTSKGVFDNTAIPDELLQIISNIHSSICDCQDINCIQFYRRFRNEKEVVYHSLAYKKRQSSISYFVKYGYLFGTIMVFMSCNGKEYAIINRHMAKGRFSDHFISSYYYSILSKPIDSFFFVLNKLSNRFDVIDIQSSIDICIVIEEDDCLVVSPLSVYHEHD